MNARFLLPSSLVLSLAIHVACGGTTIDAAPSTTDDVPHAEPPARPEVVSTGGTTRWFAMSKVFLGTVDPTTGRSGADAWRGIGFDLDHRVTTADDSKYGKNSCHRIEGSATGVLVDGNDGVDNAFGAHFMQTVKSLKSDVEDVANHGIASGDATILIRLDNVGPDDNAGVPGALYVARGLGGTPTWTESDRWPVVATSLVDGVDLSKPRATFPAGYMRGGVWVSGPVEATSAQIDFSIVGSPFALSADALQIVLQPDGGKGTISGFTRVSSLEASLAAGASSLGLCPGDATYDQVVATLTQSADLVADAPGFQDDSKPCDALSFGIGIVATPTGTPSVVVPANDPPNGCK